MRVILVIILISKFGSNLGSQQFECHQKEDDKKECTLSDIILKDGKELQFPENLDNNNVIEVGIRDSAIAIFPQEFNEHFPNLQTIFLFKSLDFERFGRHFFETEFNGVKFLRILDDVFGGFKKHLGHIEANAFGNLPNLEDIILQEIQIGTLDEQIFAPNKNLKSIRIQLTGLKVLPPKIFKGLTELEKIKITDNAIQNLHESMFHDNKKLKFIDFFYNHIKELPDNLFSNLGNLEKVNFRLNKIETLNANLFKNNDKLHEINFEENMISKIYPETFSGLKNLEMINLSINVCVNSFFVKTAEKTMQPLFNNLEKMDEILLQCYELNE